VLLPEDDPGAWANALDALLEDDAARAAASVRGRERARAHFAWPIVARAHLEFFDELLDRRSVSR
jgi:phosphatidylinositol alpha-1,6-mannosyltransferase